MISQVYWTLWFRLSMKYSPILTGVALLPVVVCTLVLAPIAGKVTDKIGAAIPVLIGSVVGMLGIAWIMVFSTFHSYWIFFPGILIYGVCPPLIFTPGVTLAMNAVEPKLRGLASGVANMSRQLGSALGLAFMGLLMFGIDTVVSHFQGCMGRDFSLQ